MKSAATAPRYDGDGRCLDCGGVGGCHSLDCPPMAAKYDEAERFAARRRPRIEEFLRERSDAPNWVILVLSFYVIVFGLVLVLR